MLLPTLFTASALPLAFATQFSISILTPPVTAPLAPCVVLTSISLVPSPIIRSFTQVCPPGAGPNPSPEASKNISVSFDTLSAEEAGNTTLALYAHLTDDEASKRSSAGCVFIFPKFTVDYIDGRNISLREYAADKKLVLWDETTNGPLSDPKTFKAIECIAEPEALLPKKPFLPWPSDSAWKTALDFAQVPDKDRNVTLSKEWLSHIIDPPLVFSAPANSNWPTYESPPIIAVPSLGPDAGASAGAGANATTSSAAESMITTTVDGQPTVVPVITTADTPKTTEKGQETSPGGVLINTGVATLKPTPTDAASSPTTVVDGVMTVLPILPYPSPSDMVSDDNSSASAGGETTIMPVLVATGKVDNTVAAEAAKTVSVTVSLIGTITEMHTVTVTVTDSASPKVEETAPAATRRRRSSKFA